MLLLIVILLLALIYFSLILFFLKGWKAAPEYELNAKKFSTRISVIIPARNEEENISVLLNALAQQDYPNELVEIIVVDDHSTDGTIKEVEKFNKVKLIRLQQDILNSYKKKAIETGIAVATGDMIITTDADCIPPKEWISTLVSYREQKGAKFIAAPVNIVAGNNTLEEFQSLDFMILQGITGAAVTGRRLSMCNGANLAYEKAAFEEVVGFSGIDHIASGDDMLLMHKISKKYPDKIFYLKSKKAIVSTSAMKTWRSFINQRIRWASKASHYDDKRIFWVLVLVYLFNVSFLVLLAAGFFQSQFWIYLFVLWILKTILEWPLFVTLARFFDKRISFLKVFLFQPLHISYTIISGLFGQFGKYEWKGRTVR